MKWLKKLAGDFAGASEQDNNKPAPAATQAPVPVPTPAPVVAPAPAATKAFRGSVQDFEKAREDFFSALKSDDSATIERIAADYPGEALGWRSEEGTPLCIAQKSNSLQSFKALLALGADKEETYPAGDFPLHYAQANGQKDFFDFLLESGADIERPFTTSTFQSRSSETTTHTALGTAILQGNKEAAITLMEHGASVIAPYTYLREYHMLSSSTPQPKPKTAVDYATEQKHFLIADIAKRAHILRSDYVAREAAPAPAPVPEPAETDSTIGVMQPLRLKKTTRRKSLGELKWHSNG